MISRKSRGRRSGKFVFTYVSGSRKGSEGEGVRRSITLPIVLKNSRTEVEFYFFLKNFFFLTTFPFQGFLISVFNNVQFSPVFGYE